jgi:predicted NBD/HSP70 family sugar kinase
MMTVTKISRQVSIERVMRAIAVFGPISRASLAKEVGLSKQTISEVMLILEDRDWVRTKGRTEGHVGRRAVTFEINPECAGVAVVDLGGTKVRACVANILGQILVEEKQTTDPRGGKAVWNQIAQMVEDLIQQSPINSEHVKLIVVGVPGVFESETGHINMAPNIQGLEQFNNQHYLESRSGLKVLIENDVNLAAKGEHWIAEQGQVFDNLVYLSVGTGLGAGIIINGELVTGVSGIAGEIGFMSVPNPKGEIVELESLCSGVALSEQYRMMNGKNRTAKDIIEGANVKEKDALDVFQVLVASLSSAILTIDYLINPSRFVLGGSIGATSLLITMLKKHLGQKSPVAEKIFRSQAGKYSPLAGGVALGLEQTQYDLFAADYDKDGSVQKFKLIQSADLSDLYSDNDGGKVAL